MRVEFEKYKEELEEIKLTQNSKKALVRALAERKPEQKTKQPVRPLRVALIAACVCLILVGTAFAAEWARQQAMLVTGGELLTWFDEEGHEMFTWGSVEHPIDFAKDNPVEIRDGRMWFVAGGKELDITDLVDENTPYIYTSTLADGHISHVIVGGTPEDYGFAECVLRLNGMPLGMSGVGYSWMEVLEEGVMEPADYVAPGEEVYVITGEKSVHHYANWMLAAAEQLGFSEFLITDVG